MPSEFDLWTRVVIPLTTFTLGALVTFLVQRYWRNRDVVAQSAKALAELTADWYNQLDDLRRSLNEAAEPTKAANLVDGYIRSRLILPKVLYHVAVLRERNAHPELVSQVEEFLCLVTSYDRLGSTRATACWDLSEGRPTDPDTRAGFLSTLRSLDEHQQAVAREAARAGR